MAKLSATYVSALIGSISAFNIQGLDFFLGDGGDLSNGVPDPSTINAWTFGLPQERVVKNQFLEMLVHFHPMKGIYSDQEIWDNVKNYGCWCWASKSENFEGEEVLAPMRGIGDPVDETDSLCQQLFYCYECAQIDHQCDSSSSQYRATYTTDWFKSEATCEDDLGTCARSTCECDKNFAKTYGQLYLDGGYDQKYHHIFSAVANGLENQQQFDPEANCNYSKSKRPVEPTKVSGRNSNGSSPERQCCGAEGRRYPFKTADNRKCCAKAGKTYDSNFQECCDTGVISAVGTC